MNLPLSNPETVARLKAMTAGFPGVTTRAMFGQTAMFVGGQMAGGTWGSTFMLRLSPTERALADDEGCTLFDPMGGRPMSEYRVLPADLPEDEVLAWVARAVAYTRALPPKAAKPARPAKKAPKRA